MRNFFYLFVSLLSILQFVQSGSAATVSLDGHLTGCDALAQAAMIHDESAMAARAVGSILLMAFFASLSLFGVQSRREGGDSPKQTAGGLPELSDSDLQLFKDNHRELSMISANCFSADKNARSFYVSSCFNGEGKTTVAASMAYGLAQDGNAKVLLVDGCSDSPRLHEMFQTAIGPGISDYICSDVPGDDILKKTAHKNLTIITYGTGGAGKGSCTRDPLRNEKMNELISHYKADFDYIIFDGHSLLNSPNAAAIAHYFDGMILAVECERTKWEVVQIASEKAEQIGARLLAVVLNKRKYYIPKFLYNHI